MPGTVHRNSGDSSVRGQREGQSGSLAKGQGESVLNFPKPCRRDMRRDPWFTPRHLQTGGSEPQAPLLPCGGESRKRAQSGPLGSADLLSRAGLSPQLQPCISGSSLKEAKQVSKAEESLN